MYRTLNGLLNNNHNTYALIFRDLTKVGLLLLGLNGCSNKKDGTTKIIHEGSYTIKARFLDGKMNGKSEYYDNSGKLTGIINYKDDEKWGMCIHYYPNGVVSDSVEYLCDKSEGYWRHYDQTGSPTHFSYFYFGLQFGPDLWYDKDTVLRKYYFLNFERQPIVECNYNRYGHLDSIAKVDLTLMVDEREKDGNPLFKFFAYLPRIPQIDQTYYIGVVDKNKVSRKICDIRTKAFLIDTMLAPPPPGFNFFLGCDLKANHGKFDETITVEAIKKDNR